MVRARADVHIGRPPHVVFAYFADLRNEPQWNRGHVRNVVMTTPEPIRIGSVFEGDHHGFGRASWAITEFQPPKRIAIEGRVGRGTYRYAGRLTPDGAGTLFQGTIEWEPGGRLGWFGPALALLLKARALWSFRNLRRELERQA